MGLDVEAYERLGEYVGPYSDELAEQLEQEFLDSPYDQEYVPTMVYVYNEDFPERLDALEPGYYRNEGVGYYFSAGSYDTYVQWRAMLARLVLDIDDSYDMSDSEGRRYEDEPFYPIIWMSDAEGTFGPETCALLALDFAEWEERLEELTGGRVDEFAPESFMSKYRQFRRAFELAADTGCVRYS